MLDRSTAEQQVDRVGAAATPGIVIATRVRALNVALWTKKAESGFMP